MIWSIFDGEWTPYVFGWTQFIALELFTILIEGMMLWFMFRDKLSLWEIIKASISINVVSAIIGGLMIYPIIGKTVMI